MNILEKTARVALNTGRVFIGYIAYLATGRTPVFAYQSMVALFCLTGGRSNDLLSRLIGMIRRPYLFDHAAGFLGDLSTPNARQPILSQLRSRGFHVFEKRLPPEQCDRLLNFALTNSCKARVMDDGTTERVVEGAYPRGVPQAARYDFDTQDLLANDDVQSLLADLSFATLAQDYLGSRPTVDVVSMWWHTAYAKTPDSQAAQYFHFDMDRPKWLKFFIYLTDVETDNGPHTFVAGSHKTNSIPENLLSKGYSRLLDEEVAEVFDKSDFLEFTAPRGTIIAEDTRGLHKGKHVHTGDRLVLQVQFSNSLFGCVYPPSSISERKSASLAEQIARFPDLYAAYLRH